MVDAIEISAATGVESMNGWKASQIFNTAITETRSGAEWRSQYHIYPRRAYTLPYKLMPRAQFVALRNFHRLRGGSARGFLLWDLTDFFAPLQQIGVGNGVSTTFQLALTYSDAAASFTEPTFHPVPTGTTVPTQLRGAATGATTASIIVKVGSTTLTEGTDYTVNHSTGLITFTVAPANTAVIQAQWYYFIPVRFTSDTFTLDLNSIYAQSNPDMLQVLYE